MDNIEISVINSYRQKFLDFKEHLEKAQEKIVLENKDKINLEIDKRIEDYVSQIKGDVICEVCGEEFIKLQTELQGYSEKLEMIENIIEDIKYNSENSHTLEINQGGEN